MNTFLKTASHAIQSFASDEEGAQVVEYALIIAVVSIALVGALSLLAGPTNPFTTFIGRVTACLNTAGACV